MTFAEPAAEGRDPVVTDRALDPVQLRRAIDTVSHLPRLWAVGLLLVAVVACFDVGRTAAGEWSFNVSVSAVVLIALALIWLPVLLRLLLLTGGTVKAGGVEASTSGMFERQHLLELLTRVKAVTTPQGDPDARNFELEQLKDVVSQLAVDALDSRQALDEAHLGRLAREYERLRRNDRPGRQRTAAMTQIVNEVRVRAASSLELADRKAEHLLKSRFEGSRIVGLGLVQEVGSSDHLHETLHLISYSSSAFEMFNALVALQEMAPVLTEKQKNEAVEAVRREQGDPREVGVLEDGNLLVLMEATVARLSS